MDHKKPIGESRKKNRVGRAHRTINLIGLVLFTLNQIKKKFLLEFKTNICVINDIASQFFLEGIMVMDGDNTKENPAQDKYIVNQFYNNFNFCKMSRAIASYV